MCVWSSLQICLKIVKILVYCGQSVSCIVSSSVLKKKRYREIPETLKRTLSSFCREDHTTFVSWLMTCDRWRTRATGAVDNVSYLDDIAVAKTHQ